MELSNVPCKELIGRPNPDTQPAFQPVYILTINGASPDMYIIDPTLIHMVIQKIPDKSGRTLMDDLEK